MESVEYEEYKEHKKITKYISTPNGKSSYTTHRTYVNTNEDNEGPPMMKLAENWHSLRIGETEKDASSAHFNRF